MENRILRAQYERLPRLPGHLLTGLLVTWHFLSLPVFMPGQEKWFESWEKHSSFLGREMATINNGVQDEHGFIWFATDKGLARYDGYQFAMFNPDVVDTTTLSSSHLREIALMGDSLLALGTGPGFLELFDLKTGMVRHLDMYTVEERAMREGGPVNTVRDILIDSRGLLWVAGQFGLREVDPASGTINRYMPFDYTFDFTGWGGDPNLIWDIEPVRDDRDKLFIGGQHGLFIFDIVEKQFSRVDTALKHVTTLFHDNRGKKLYVNSWTLGLFRYDLVNKRSDQLQGYGRLTESLKFQRLNDTLVFLYHHERGFGTLNLNDGSVFFPEDPELNPWLPVRHTMVASGGLIDRNNQFWVFSGYNHWIFQLQRARPFPEPEICVTQVATSAVPVIWLDHNSVFTVPDNQTDINIRFAAVNPPFPDSVSYSYKLDDGPWQSIGSAREVAFNNLEQGRHKLSVRASDERHFGTVEQPVLEFRIQLPLYKRLWFQVLLVLGALAIASVLVRVRNKQLRSESTLKEYEKEMAELELKALRSQMNPHFMFNSLNSIKNYILQADTKLAAEYLSNFAHLIRLILQNSREKLITLKNELDTLMLYIDMEKMRFEDEFEFKCIVDESVDLDSVYLPPMILQPYVENAIWHGLMHKKSKGQLIIRIQSAGERIECIIEDDGIGRDAASKLKDGTAQKHKSMGMGITKDRIDIINRMSALGIEIDIEDLYENGRMTPCGTRVTVFIPKDQRYDESYG